MSAMTAIVDLGNCLKYVIGRQYVHVYSLPVVTLRRGAFCPLGALVHFVGHHIRSVDGV